MPWLGVDPNCLATHACDGVRLIPVGAASNNAGWQIAAESTRTAAVQPATQRGQACISPQQQRVVSRHSRGGAASSTKLPLPPSDHWQVQPGRPAVSPDSLMRSMILISCTW